MEFDDDYTYDEEYKLTRELLYRYVDLGCTLDEAFILTNRTLDGEAVVIRTGIKGSKNELNETPDPNSLFDFLFGEEDDFS